MSFAATAVVGGIATLGGAAISASAASKAAKAQQNAGKDAQQLKVQQDMLAQFRADLAYYGKDEAIRRLRQNAGGDVSLYLGEKAADPNFGDADRARYDELGRIVDAQGYLGTASGGQKLPWMRSDQNSSSAAQARVAAAKAERDALFAKAGGKIGSTGLINIDDVVDKPGLIQQLRGLTNEREAYNNSLMADAGDIEAMLANYGKGQEERIRRDSDRALTGANRLTRSTLMGRGLGGGTALAGSLERNARSINESMSNQLSDLGDRQIQMRAAAKGDTLNLRNSLANQLFQYKSQPINAEMGYATSNIQNPWLGVDTTQFVSSASPSANSGAVWGNLFSGLGGQFSNLGMMGLMNNRGGTNNNAAGGVGQGGTVNGVYYPPDFIGPTPRPN